MNVARKRYKKGQIQRTMTVYELVKKLQEFPPEMPVIDNGWISKLVVERCRVQTGGHFNHKAVRICYEL